MKTLLSRHMLCTSQFEASTLPPPGLACSNSLSSGQKSRSNAPPISTEIPLLKDKFRLQGNTVHTFQREICGGNTFKLRYSLTKAKFYLVNPSNLAKNRKISREHYARARDKSASNSPPWQSSVQIPPFPGTMDSQMPEVCPGGMLKLQFDRYITGDISVEVLEIALWR